MDIRSMYFYKAGLDIYLTEPIVHASINKLMKITGVRESREIKDALILVAGLVGILRPSECEDIEHRADVVRKWMAVYGLEPAKLGVMV